jgi:hypothetical protein
MVEKKEWEKRKAGHKIPQWPWWSKNRTVHQASTMVVLDREKQKP